MALGRSSPLPCPADREAAALQGRAERAGACDEPLAARPALAVAIRLSFASCAKERPRRREQEIAHRGVRLPAAVNGPAVATRVRGGPDRADADEPGSGEIACPASGES